MGEPITVTLDLKALSDIYIVLSGLTSFVLFYNIMFVLFEGEPLRVSHYLAIVLMFLLWGAVALLGLTVRA